nr:MAG TPA: hypothetical protein [Caudoviricetes sp.]
MSWGKPGRRGPHRSPGKSPRSPRHCAAAPDEDTHLPQKSPPSTASIAQLPAAGKGNTIKKRRR